MRGGRRAGAAGAVLGAAVLLSSGSGSSGAEHPTATECGPSFGPVRDTAEVYLVGIPSADTVEAGTEGDVIVFGQVVESSRIAGLDAPGDSVSDVILVPWGFDAECRPIVWTGEWAWAERGDEAFFRGHLRPDDEWSGGLPTIDVYGAVWEGLPHSRWQPAAATGRGRMGADELFELYDLLPTEADYRERPYGAVAGLVQWRRQHGEEAVLYPAPEILRGAFERAENARLRSEPLPYGGTYRVHLEIGGDTVASFFMRTADVATAAAAGFATRDRLPLAPEPAASLALRLEVASTLEGLIEPGNRAPACSRSDGLHIATTPERDDGRQIWRAELMTGSVAGCLGDHEPFSTLAAAPDDGTHFGGWFRREVDGTYTFVQRVSSSAGPALLTGERMDRSTTVGARTD